MSQKSKLHKIWIEQCDAARTIRLRYGVDAAFDYLVGEKLMTFAEAAITHPEFKNDLPRFISEVRAIFSKQELNSEVARFEKKLQRDNADAVSSESRDDVFIEGPKTVAERAERFAILKTLLAASQLGTA